MKNRNHFLWILYEYVAATIGWTGILSFFLFFFINPLSKTLIDFEIPYIEIIGNWFNYSFGVLLVKIMFLDRVKYKITKDPLDEPYKKWFTFR